MNPLAEREDYDTLRHTECACYNGAKKIDPADFGERILFFPVGPSARDSFERLEARDVSQIDLHVSFPERLARIAGLAYHRGVLANPHQVGVPNIKASGIS